MFKLAVNNRKAPQPSVLISDVEGRASALCDNRPTVPVVMAVKINTTRSALVEGLQ